VQGGSYIDTCNLDGETNLKIKTSLTITRDCTSVEKVINPAIIGGFDNIMLDLFPAKVTCCLIMLNLLSS
jgi:hypothetical protein